MKLFVSYSFLDAEHKSVFQIAPSRHNFEKFAIKVAKNGCFHKLCDIIATICVKEILLQSKVCC